MADKEPPDEIAVAAASVVSMLWEWLNLAANADLQSQTNAVVAARLSRFWPEPPVSSGCKWCDAGLEPSVVYDVRYHKPDHNADFIRCTKT